MQSLAAFIASLLCARGAVCRHLRLSQKATLRDWYDAARKRGVSWVSHFFDDVPLGNNGFVARLLPGSARYPGSLEDWIELALRRGACSAFVRLTRVSSEDALCWRLTVLELGADSPLISPSGLLLRVGHAAWLLERTPRPRLAALVLTRTVCVRDLVRLVFDWLGPVCVLCS